MKVTSQALHNQIKKKGLDFKKSKNRIYFSHNTAKILLGLVFTPQVITFQIVKGGTGKTSICLAVGVRACLYGAKTLLIDLDRSANIASFLKSILQALLAEFLTIKTIEFPGNQNSLTRVLDIMKDAKGNIWFSANALGVGMLMANDKIQWYQSIKGFKATSVCQDKSGRIWIGSNSSLYYLKSNKIVEYEHNKLFYNSGVRKIYASDKDGIYIGGIYGLWHVNNDTVIKLKTEDE